MQAKICRKKTRLSQSPFSLGYFFWERKKLGDKMDFSRLLSAIFFGPVFWLEGSLYFNQSKTTSFVYLTQNGTVFSLTFRANFSKINNISCKRNKSSSRRLSRLPISISRLGTQEVDLLQVYKKTRAISFPNCCRPFLPFCNFPAFRWLRHEREIIFIFLDSSVE